MQLHRSRARFPLVALGTFILLATSSAAQPESVIEVSNIEELYTAVNEPTHAGAIVVLASGRYALTTRNPSGQMRANGGRLVLQPDMTLVGQNEYMDFDHDGTWDPRDDDRDGVPDTDPVRGLTYAAPDSETIIDAV